MTETQTGTGSQGTPEQVVVSSVLKETNEIVLKWTADGFMAKYPMNNLNLTFEPVHGQTATGYFIGSRLIKLELVSSPEPETKPEPVKPTQNPVKNPPEQKQPEPAGKPWHRTAKVGKIVVNPKNGMVQLNCSYKDFKTQELKLWSVVIPEKLSDKIQQFKEGDLITIHSVGNVVTDVEKKEYNNNKYFTPEQKQPEPAGKPWHRTAKVGKMVVNPKNGMVQLNCSYKDYKTQELKLWSVIIPEKLSDKIQQFKEGDLITIHSVGNVVTDVEKKEYNNNKYSTPVQKPVVTIGGTINLQNYENIRIEISGPFDGQDDITRYIQTLKETALQFGKDEVTQGFVRAYVKRTFGE